MLFAAILACLLPPPAEPSWLCWGEARVLSLRISLSVGFLFRVSVYSEDTEEGLGRWKGRAIFLQLYRQMWVSEQFRQVSDTRLPCARHFVRLPVAVSGWRSWMWPPWLGSWPFHQGHSFYTKCFLIGRQISQIILTIRGTRGELQNGNLGSLDR